MNARISIRNRNMKRQEVVIALKYDWPLSEPEILNVYLRYPDLIPQLHQKRYGQYKILWALILKDKTMLNPETPPSLSLINTLLEYIVARQNSKNISLKSIRKELTEYIKIIQQFWPQLPINEIIEQNLDNFYKNHKELRHKYFFE